MPKLPGGRAGNASERTAIIVQRTRLKTPYNKVDSGGMHANLCTLILGETAESEQGPFDLLWAGPMKQLFALQIADILSTVIFRSMGIAESNPLVDILMERFGTLGGLLLVKVAAILIAVLTGIATRPVFVRRINWIYCGFLSLNTLTILSAL